jgi:hypothetical protein
MGRGNAYGRIRLKRGNIYEREQKITEYIT